MSIRITLNCDGHRHGQPCYSSRTVAYAHSPTLRSDDTRRAYRPDTTDWHIGATPTGGDLCPTPGHDEDPDPTPLTVEVITPRTMHLEPGDTAPEDDRWNSP